MDLIGYLTRFRRLDVIAYTSAAAAPPGLPPRQLGARLDARYVLQGVLWLSRSRLRLKIDLISTETERVVWSHDYSRMSEDIFEVEREVASAAASGVMVEIDQLERTRVRARDPNSLATYALWLRGLDEMLTLRAGALPGCARPFLPGGRARPHLRPGLLGHLARAWASLEVPLDRAARRRPRRCRELRAQGRRCRRQRSARECGARLGRALPARSRPGDPGLRACDRSQSERRRRYRRVRRRPEAQRLATGGGALLRARDWLNPYSPTTTSPT